MPLQDKERMHEERRKIIHIDMDAFYASVEIRDNPFLKNSAVAVGGSARKRGIICTCNYKALSLGVRSAMPTIRALKLCPDLILLPVDMPKYQSVSNEIRKILFDYTSIVEPVSLDEAYLDVSDCLHFSGSATWIGQDIRQKIKDKLSLTVSVGIASNKFLAKFASEHNKPDGLFVIEPQQTLSFISHLPVSEINGVGQVTRQKLKDMKIHTFFDLQKASLPELTRRFGVWGKKLHDFSFGKDDRPVEPDRVRKSLSVEQTFPHDINPSLIEEELLVLYKQLQERLNSNNLTKIRKQFIKVKFHNFTLVTRGASVSVISLEIFRKLLDVILLEKSMPVRLLGMGVGLRSFQGRDGHQLCLNFPL